MRKSSAPQAYGLRIIGEVKWSRRVRAVLVSRLSVVSRKIAAPSLPKYDVYQVVLQRRVPGAASIIEASRRSHQAFRGLILHSCAANT